MTTTTTKGDENLAVKYFWLSRDAEQAADAFEQAQDALAAEFAALREAKEQAERERDEAIAHRDNISGAYINLSAALATERQRAAGLEGALAVEEDADALADHDGGECNAQRGNWWCSRREGHPRSHVAAGGGEILARWPALSAPSTAPGAPTRCPYVGLTCLTCRDGAQACEDVPKTDRAAHRREAFEEAAKACEDYRRVLRQSERDRGDLGDEAIECADAILALAAKESE